MADKDMIAPFKALHITPVAALESRLFDHGLSEYGLQALLDGPAFHGLVYGAAPLAYLLAHVTADEAEILSLGTIPDHQRQGLAAALCRHFIAAMTIEKKEALFLEVAADNDAAIKLYNGVGFYQISIRPAYYRRPGTRVDAIVMRHSLTTSFS